MKTQKPSEKGSEKEIKFIVFSQSNFCVVGATREAEAGKNSIFTQSSLFTHIPDVSRACSHKFDVFHFYNYGNLKL
jgi:hypothetical protein